MKADLVKNELLHLELIKLKAVKRKKKLQEEKVKEKSKQYQDYDWVKLYNEKRVGFLKVPELNLYLAKHKLPMEKMYKRDKVALIEANIATHVAGEICKKFSPVAPVNESSSDTSDSDSDTEVEYTDSSSDSE